MENQQEISIQTKNNIAEQVSSLRNISNSQVPHPTEEKALIKENISTFPQDAEVTKENNNRVYCFEHKKGLKYVDDNKNTRVIDKYISSMPNRIKAVIYIEGPSN